jgi:DNA-directed RNA polymerase
LDVFNALREAGDSPDVLPSVYEEPLPMKPWDKDEEPEIDVLRAWKKQANAVYDLRVEMRSKRIATEMKRFVANKFKDEPEIYFCWTMDWRGRVYPLQPHVNPQADDLGRSLLEYAEAKPLGENGGKWLAIHGANCFGEVDKESFDKRVAWVEANTHKIIEVSKDPINNRWWAEAEDQWQFLAFCFEWADMVLNYGGDTRQFPSHLSIQLDGTCNGLQNFSALLRDEDGGKATNVVPQDTPSDIYQEVADVLIEMVGEDARKGIDEAKLWKGKDYP